MQTYLEDDMIIPIDNTMRYRVSTYTYADMPDGDGYAPQVLLSWDRCGYDSVPLNVHPYYVSSIRRAANELSQEKLERFINIYFPGSRIIHEAGYSQGDIYMCVVLKDSEWLKDMGLGEDWKPTEADGMEMINWARGDVWEVLKETLETWTNSAGETMEVWEVQDSSGPQYATTVEELHLG